MTTACDTSVLVPALAAWHVDHEVSASALAGVTAIPAHVELETYSVLTRLPGGQRISAGLAAAALGALVRERIALPATEMSSLITRLAHVGIDGGAVYDALVGLTAAHHGLTLLTRDRRARHVYDTLEVRYTML